MSELIIKDPCWGSLDSGFSFDGWLRASPVQEPSKIVVKYAQINGAKHQSLSLGVRVEQVAGI